MAVAKYVKTQLITKLSGEQWFTEELHKELPGRWEKHGDLVLLPEKTFATIDLWKQHPYILQETCKLLHCSRLARRVGPTQSDDFRSPKVQLLFGNSTLVTKKENGILYSWDLSKCMFSSGNITEKQRIASWDLKGKTVIDMYAGIGYFTLTYLVHSKAMLVYACEWNPDAVEALQVNLKLNKVPSEKCIILFGDNRETCPTNVADHVNLGLIPSSEKGWATACAALKKETGGMLHVHGNVDTKCHQAVNSGTSGSDVYDTGSSTLLQSTMYQVWSNSVCTKIRDIFRGIYPNETWSISLQGILKIKSFAPHVDHVVADIICKPLPSK